MANKTYYQRLDDRGFLKISGDDRISFLQGLITNDVNKLKDQDLIYACLLTPQGKYAFDFFLFEGDGAIILDCEKERLALLMKKFKLFKLRAKVELEDVSDHFTCFAFWGNVRDSWSDPRKPELLYRFYAEDKAFQPMGVQGDYRLYRYQIGLPEGAGDMVPGSSTMQECNMDHLHALDWDKGCYMGQELTARIHYRGLVKRRLFPFSFEGKAPEVGQKIETDGRTIGEVRSVHQEGAGLALMRLDADCVGKTVDGLTF